MGQHKYNPTAIKAKNGEIPPKPKKMGKREMDRLIYAKCQEIMFKPLIEAYEKLQTQEFDQDETEECNDETNRNNQKN